MQMLNQFDSPQFVRENRKVLKDTNKRTDAYKLSVHSGDVALTSERKNCNYWKTKVEQLMQDKKSFMTMIKTNKEVSLNLSSENF